MERYIYLILYNTYLVLEKDTNFTRPFSQWMKEVGRVRVTWDRGVLRG